MDIIVSAFVISNWLSATPYLVLIAGAIAYYLSGLKRGVDHFVYILRLSFVRARC